MDSVLVVDDGPGPRTLMSHWVQSVGCAARTAESADQALARLSEEPAAVALCDIRMPGHDGLWLAGQLRERYPDTAVIMTTGLQERDPAVTSLRTGAIDYLVKPFTREQFWQALQRGLDWHRTTVDARNWRRRQEDDPLLRETASTDPVADQHATPAGTLDALLGMLTVRDASAGDHARRVADLSVNIALTLGVVDPELADVKDAALLHDVGKIAMPDVISRKPADLTREEREVMSDLPWIGFDLVHHVPSVMRAAHLVLAVREWFDGNGYPTGLAGAQIPLGSRIIAVADAYDVMTHRQIYREAMSPGEALRELQRCSATQFDPAVVDALLFMMGEADTGGAAAA